MSLRVRHGSHSRAGGYPGRDRLDAIGDERAGCRRFRQPMLARPQADHRALCRAAARNQRQPAAKPGGFFLPDAFTNPRHVHYALKTTAAAMFCYCLYTLLDWPGIHTCFITCYIVALATAAEAVEKLMLRVLGCMLGAAAGIARHRLRRCRDLTSIGALMGVVFAAAFASAWIAAGTPRISYVGFQIAFAFFLCVIQGPAPAFDMTIGAGSRHRHPDRRFRLLSGLHRDLAGQRRKAYRSGDRGPASAGRRARAAKGGGSAVLAAAGANGARRHGAGPRAVRYEPRSIRPGPDWLEQRCRRCGRWRPDRRAAVQRDRARHCLRIFGRSPPPDRRCFDCADGPGDGGRSRARASRTGGPVPSPPHSWMAIFETFETLAASVAAEQSGAPCDRLRPRG